MKSIVDPTADHSTANDSTDICIGCDSKIKTEHNVCSDCRIWYKQSLIPNAKVGQVSICYRFQAFRCNRTEKKKIKKNSAKNVGIRV